MGSTRDQICVPCIGRQILNYWVTREVPRDFKIKVYTLKKIVIYLRLAALGLFAARGLALVAASRLLNAVASLVAEHGL